ncbi:hypothetical protein DERP_011663 [Dermatophagoides pteronyssinus]|uniref:Uncharacterized protein n=1 Tax=Dermatophagoides pteronyssinus TaxID=6956 RepID=A0ABQ8JX33_DERPT|nr:hypothetical protein DERP_011663 [Dermatophagoides pteronyssinus]
MASKQMIIILMFITLIFFNVSNAVNNNGETSTISSSSTTTTTARNDEQQNDQIASPSDQVDETSTDKSSSSSSSSATKPQQRTGSVESSNSVTSSPSNSQRLLQLLQSTEPGRFIPLSNQEIGDGHVTMIGYTTPIVRVGEPIPIEQYLREQRQFHEQHQHQQQQPILQQGEISRILERLNQKFYSNNNNNPVTESSLASSAQESTDIPLRLLLTPNPSLMQQQHHINDNNLLIHKEHFSRQDQQAINNAKLLNIPNSNSLMVDQINSEFQSGIPDFCNQIQAQQQPHVNTISGSTPALFQHFSAQLPFGQPAFRPIQAVSRLTNGIHSPQQQQQQQQHFGQAHSSFIRTQPTQQGHVSGLSSQLTTANGFIPSHQLQHSVSKESSAISQQQQPSISSQFFTNNNIVSPQSITQPFHIAKKQTVQVETVEGPPSSNIDTKAELQNQIKHILASSPNLSEDSRARHREAIFKAVHSLIEPTTSSDSSSSSANQHQSQIQSTDSTSSNLIDTANRFNSFEPFNPKSMLFNFPNSQQAQRSNLISRPTPSTLALSSLSSGHHQQQANIVGIRPSTTTPVQMNQFQLSPLVQQSGKLPFNLLSRFPSLLPGFQSSNHGLLSSPADTNKQQQDQSSNDHRIQNQIQTFLQQHDPQRLQLTQSTSSSSLQQPQQPQEFTSGSFMINQPMFGQPQTQPQSSNNNANQQFQQNMAKIRLAPGLMLSSDDSTGSGSSDGQQRQVHTQEGGIVITRGKPILMPPEANRISVVNQPDDDSNNNNNNNVRFHANSLQAQASQQPHHHHHHYNQHHHHNHNHHPNHNRLQTFQSDSSMITPKTNSREFSEWWKERAVAPSDIAPMTMLTQLPA